MTETANGQLLAVRVEDADEGPSVVSLTGELDLSTIPLLEGKLFEQLRSHSGVVVDLTDLRFIDSSGISLLIRAHRDGDGAGLHTVIAPGSQVERVFRITGIDRALPLFFDRTEARAALNGAGGSARGS